MTDFFNPYNFIPTPPRTGDFPKELQDAEPVGHHRLHDDRWSGSITVDMEAVSPLLVPSGEFSVDKAGHKTKSTRTVAGRVCIPPSSVKGMIRSAFEAVTNSRFGEFAHHERPLAFRQEARDGSFVFPAVIKDGRIRVLLNGNPPPAVPTGDGFAVPKGTGMASIPVSRLVYRDPVTGKDVKVRHGEDIMVSISAMRGSAALKATEVRSIDANIGDHESLVWGRAYITGQPKGFFNKKSEKVFLVGGDPSTDLYFDLTPEIQRQWRDLIADAREKHRDDGQDFCAYAETPKTGSVDEWGELRDYSLCFVLLGRDSKSDGLKVLLAQPVSLSRQLHPSSPLELLDPSLRPATMSSEFSPADRVFGWVNGSAGDARDTAYAGSVRFGAVECLSNDAIEDFNRALPILAQPKPEQARFYLGRRTERSVEPFASDLAKRQVQYESGKDRALRGRKVYPNQNRMPADGKVPAGNQNQTYRDRVRAGSRFRFTVNVRNLSAVELGALLFVLDVERASGGAGRCLSLGGGKPLGYGSVSVKVDWSATSLARGSEIRDALAAFRAPRNETEVAKATVEHFVSLVRGRPFFEAFITAAKGYRAEDPVHYPRINPPTGDSSDIFKWFGENESVRQRKVALPRLTTDREGRLPYYQAKPTGGRDGGGRGGPPRRR